MTRFIPLRSMSVVLLGIVGGVGGCGNGLPPTAPVVGKVTYQGQVVTEGKIAFYPAKGRPAFGQIQADGRYALTTFEPGDGAVLGPHRVTIEAMQIVAQQAPPQTFEEEIARATTPQRRPPATPQVHWLVPQRYAREETSPLTADVKNSDNVIDFAVPGES